MGLRVVPLALMLLALPGSVVAQDPPPRQRPAQQPVPAARDYVVGSQDVLIITSYDQADLSGKFTVEADGTFTYPLTGRVHAGGLTLREVEAELKQQLIEQGFFRKPQITVAIEEYKSQKIFIVGEVRRPGAYPLSGDMRLIEALALAGSTLPTASGEAVIVRASNQAVIVDSSEQSDPDPPAWKDAAQNVIRVNLRDLENGVLSQNLPLRGGDTIFVLRAENVFVFGQVKNPGAYPLHPNTTVLQALSLAGGVTDRGSMSRIQIVRIVNGEKAEIRAQLSDAVQAGDTIVVPERFF